MKEKKLIAFDLYDTCFEFKTPSDQLSYKQLFHDAGISNQRKELKNILLTSHRSIEDILSDACPDAKMHIHLEKYYENLRNEIAAIELFPETKDVLSSLKEKGYKIAAISNISVPYTEALYKLLPHTFHYEILSCDVGVSKPDKKIFDILTNMSGYSPNEIMMVGDSLYSDIQGAKNAGIYPIQINRNSVGIKKHEDYISISTLEQLFDIL